MPRLAHALLVAGLSLALAPPALAGSKRTKAKKQIVILDGIAERVNWNDGDSFRILRGDRDGQRARLRGYNTLESYGPVHFWGDFNGWDLYRTHKAATKLAKSERWECSTNGEVDGYGRILVDCPGLRMRLISEGLAHVYAYGDEVPDPALLAAQIKAQGERKGMWARGIPQAIITSVHSLGEPNSDGTPREFAYNRLCNTRSGKTFVVKHTTTFEPCDVFCYAGSCMVYVPFDHRYGAKKPECLKGKNGERNRMTAAPHLNQPLDLSDRR